MDIFPIGKVLPLSGPPNPGVASESTVVPVLFKIIASEFVVKSTAIPVPPVIVLISMALPASLDIGIFLEPSEAGVSLNAEKVI
jgi:hypothetical protein